MLYKYLDQSKQNTQIWTATGKLDTYCLYKVFERQNQILNCLYEVFDRQKQILISGEDIGH